MGDRKQPSPPPGDPGYKGPPQIKPAPPPAPPSRRGMQIAATEIGMNLLTTTEATHLGE